MNSIVKKRTNKFLVGTLVVFGLTLAACSNKIADNSQPSDSPDSAETSAPASPLTVSGADADSTGSGSGVDLTQEQTITMTVDKFLFNPSTVRLKQGQKVKIQLTGINGKHSFLSNDLNIDVAVDAGEVQTFDVPTDKTGTFEFHCGIPCGPGHKEMTGQIIIE